MRTARIKLFCIVKDSDTERCDLVHRMLEDNVIEEAHYRREPEWDHWYVVYYPMQADAEEQMQLGGAILVPHFADPDPIGDNAQHFHPSVGIQPTHTGFQVAKKMATSLGSPFFKPSAY